MSTMVKVGGAIFVLPVRGFCCGAGVLMEDLLSFAVDMIDQEILQIGLDLRKSCGTLTPDISSMHNNAPVEVAIYLYKMPSHEWQYRYSRILMASTPS